MLIRNGAYFNCIAGHNHSGVTSITNFINPMTMLGWFTQSQNDGKQSQIIRDSFPTGTNPPYSYVMGHKGTLLVSSNTTNGVGELTGNAAMGRAIASTDLNGTGTISSASLSLIIQLACTDLNGIGSLSGSMSGLVQLASTLAGAGEITSALQLIAYIVSNITGTGSVTSTLRGTASLEAEITPFTELSPENLAASVWNSVAASFNEAGTMGEKMNDAGGAANPWNEIIESGYTAAEILKLLAAASLGKTSGQPNNPVFRDIADTKDRITGVVDSSGNRTSVTLDET